MSYSGPHQANVVTSSFDCTKFFFLRVSDFIDSFCATFNKADDNAKSRTLSMSDSRRASIRSSSCQACCFLRCRARSSKNSIRKCRQRAVLLHWRQQVRNRRQIRTSSIAPVATERGSVEESERNGEPAATKRVSIHEPEVLNHLCRIQWRHLTENQPVLLFNEHIQAVA